MKYKGRAWIFGDNIDTDQIYPGKYLPLTDKEEMALHAMEGTERGEDFIRRVSKGDCIVAGKNFGCGSSREHATVAIKGCGISVIIARSFARIFRRNAVNTGLPILELEGHTDIAMGDVLELDTETGAITNLTQRKDFRARPLSALEQEIMNAGGLLAYLKRVRD